MSGDPAVTTDDVAVSRHDDLSAQGALDSAYQDADEPVTETAIKITITAVNDPCMDMIDQPTEGPANSPSPGEDDGEETNAIGMTSESGGDGTQTDGCADSMPGRSDDPQHEFNEPPDSDAADEPVAMRDEADLFLDIGEITTTAAKDETYLPMENDDGLVVNEDGPVVNEDERPDTTRLEVPCESHDSCADQEVVDEQSTDVHQPPGTTNGGEMEATATMTKIYADSAVEQTPLPNLKCKDDEESDVSTSGNNAAEGSESTTGSLVVEEASSAPVPVASEEGPPWDSPTKHRLQTSVDILQELYQNKCRECESLRDTVAFLKQAVKEADDLVYQKTCEMEQLELRLQGVTYLHEERREGEGGAIPVAAKGGRNGPKPRRRKTKSKREHKARSNKPPTPEGERRKSESRKRTNGTSSSSNMNKATENAELDKPKKSSESSTSRKSKSESSSSRKTTSNSSRSSKRSPNAGLTKSKPKSPRSNKKKEDPVKLKQKSERNKRKEALLASILRAKTNTHSPSVDLDGVPKLMLFSDLQDLPDDNEESVATANEEEYKSMDTIEATENSCPELMDDEGETLEKDPSAIPPKGSLLITVHDDIMEVSPEVGEAENVDSANESRAYSGGPLLTEAPRLEAAAEATSSSNADEKTESIDIVATMTIESSSEAVLQETALALARSASDGNLPPQNPSPPLSCFKSSQAILEQSRNLFSSMEEEEESLIDAKEPLGNEPVPTEVVQRVPTVERIEI